jgi:hypothetical protein
MALLGEQKFLLDAIRKSKAQSAGTLVKGFRGFVNLLGKVHEGIVLLVRQIHQFAVKI